MKPNEEHIPTRAEAERLRLSAWLDGELPPEERAAAEAAAAANSELRRAAAEWRRLDRAAGALPVPPEDASGTAAQRAEVLRRIKKFQAGDLSLAAEPLRRRAPPPPPEPAAERWARARENVLRRLGATTARRRSARRPPRIFIAWTAIAAALACAVLAFAWKRPGGSDNGDTRAAAQPPAGEAPPQKDKPGGKPDRPRLSRRAEPAFAEVLDDRYQLVVRNVAEDRPAVVCFFLKETPE